MSWFNLNVNESLSNLKGQLTNVSNVVHDVFTEGILEQNDSNTSPKKENTEQEEDAVLVGLESANKKIDELNILCEAKDKKIQELYKHIDLLKSTSFVKTPKSKLENYSNEVELQTDLEENWFCESEISSTPDSSSKNVFAPLPTESLHQIDVNIKAQLLDENESKILQLLNENSELKFTINNLRSESDKKLEELDQQHNDVIQGLLSVKDGLQQKVTSLETDLTKLYYDQNEAKVLFDQLNEKYKHLLTSNQELTASFSNIENKYKTCIEEKSQLSVQVDDLQNQVILKTAEVDELNKILEEKETFSRAGSDEFEKIDLEKDKIISSDVNKLQIELDEINERLSTLNDIKDQYDSNVSKLSAVIAERNNLEEQLTNLRIANDGLLKEVQVARAAVEKLEILQQNLDEINSEKEQNELALVTLQEDDLLLQREFDQLKADKEKLTIELSSAKTLKNDHIICLEDKCKDMEMQLEQLIEENRNLNEKRLADVETLQSKGDEKKLSGLKQNNDFDKDKKPTESITFEELKSIISQILNVNLSDKYNTIEKLLDFFLKSVKETYQQIEDIEKNRESLMKQFESVSAEKSTLKHTCKTLEADLHHYEAEVAELMKNNGILLNELENIKAGKLETISEYNEENILHLESQLDECNKLNYELQEKYKNASCKIDEAEEEKHELIEQVANLKQLIENQHETINDLRKQSKNLATKNMEFQSQIDQLRTDDYEDKITNQMNQITDVSTQLETLNMRNSVLVENMEEMQNEKEALIKRNKELEQSAFNEVKLQRDFKILQQEMINVQNENKTYFDELQALNGKIIDTNEILRNLEKLQEEKIELVTALQIKHNENVQYHTKIQEQNQALISLQQTIETQDKQFKHCAECQNTCEKLKIMTQENERLQDEISFQKNNLHIKQGDVETLEQKKIKLFEENQILTRDLTRLRQHLIEIENNYTTEMIELQNTITLLRQEIAIMQEEVRNSSTAYTSASIRANQQTETLQAQYIILQQQKSELSTKLSEAEDRESKNRAALVNLQCVLEQFQKDKDRDVEAITKRTLAELNEEISKQNILKNEIQGLKMQLEEAKTGLRAANRISDQLEIEQITNTALKEELQKTQEKLHISAEQFHQMESNQADRVEKSLLKNLLIGYIVATNNDKMQILKLISSVLDFNQQEYEKVGLHRTHTGWLDSIFQTNTSVDRTGDTNKGSLVEAFVKFLEKESQPVDEKTQTQLLNISSQLKCDDIKSTTSQSNLLSEQVMQTLNTPRNSSCILKDILNDT